MLSVIIIVNMAILVEVFPKDQLNQLVLFYPFPKFKYCGKVQQVYLGNHSHNAYDHCDCNHDQYNDVDENDDAEKGGL